MADAIALGRLIRESRLEKGMSLGQLAAAVGRSSSSVRRWERGEVPPAAAVIDKLADVLELDPDEIRDLRPAPVMAPPMAEPPVRETRPTTLEQPVVDVSPESQSRGSEPEPGAGDQPPTGPKAEPARARGFIADVWAVVVETTRNWTGWIRGLLTFGVLLVMLFVLVWALGELFDAIGEVWDSFGIG